MSSTGGLVDRRTGPRPDAAAWFGVVAATARRDLRVLLGYRAQVLMRLGSAVGTLLSIYFIAKLVGESSDLGPYSGRYLAFATIGLAALALTATGLSGITSTLADEQRLGTLELLITSPSRLSAVMVGMTITPLAATGITVLAYMLVSQGLGAGLHASGVVPALVVAFLLVVDVYAVGLAACAFLLVAKRADPLTGLLMQVSTLAAGALFPVEVMPRAVSWMANLLPAYYGLDGMRRALILDEGWSGVALDLVVLASFAAVLLPGCWWLFRKALDYGRRSGTLGTY